MSIQQHVDIELPTDRTFDRMLPQEQRKLVLEAFAAQFLALRRVGQEPSYWQRLHLKQAIELFSNGFFGSCLTRLRQAQQPPPPDLPQIEKDARRWTLTFLEHALKEAASHPRRRPRGL